MQVVPLSVGDKAPDFTLSDGEGNRVSLADYLAPKGVLVAFIHNTWCPECIRGVIGLSRTYWFIHRLGVRMLIIAHQSESSLASYLLSQKLKLPFPILADETGQVFTNYNLIEDIDIHRAKAAFFVDQRGTIRKINTGLKFGVLTPFGL